MRITFRLARLELKALFYSPIAWLMLTIFLVQCALSYTSRIDSLVSLQELRGHSGALNFLTQKIIGLPTGIMPGVMGWLYLYMPLLTMGVMSRETASGTIRLLYSSPVKMREIVLGKYLALLVYSLLLTLVVAIFGIAALCHIQSPDTGMIFSGLLAVFLLLATYSAIGLFMSCLTTYQVVAAISTLALFAVLGNIGTVWQDVDFVRDITYFLSISGRASEMVSGLITTKDVIYFLVIIYIFLGLSVYKLRSARESKPAPVKVGRYLLVLVAGLAIGYISSRPALVGYYDATTTQTNTLTPNSQKAIGELKDAPLEVTTYVNLFDKFVSFGLPKAHNWLLSRWTPFLRFKPDIRFRYVYYYDSVQNDRMFDTYHGKNLPEVAERYAKTFKTDTSLFLPPDSIHKLIDLRPEMNRMVMRLSYNGKSTFLRMFDDLDPFPSETETSAALKRLTTARLPRIAFVQGELERSIDRMGERDYKMLVNSPAARLSLINQGFDVETVSLDKEISADITVLVIADPKVAFTPQALEILQHYITAGGNLLVMGEPGKKEVLNAVVQPLGVQFTDGILVQPARDKSPDLLLPRTAATAGTLSKGMAATVRANMKVAMPGAAALSYVDKGEFKMTPLLTTDPRQTWIRLAPLVTDSADVVFSPAEGDVRADVPVALQLTRTINGREQRIFITGDADFMSNNELGRRNMKTANFLFCTSLMGWFTHGQFPIDTSRPSSRDNSMKLTSEGVKRMKIALVWILPGILAAGGIILLIRRKRK